MLRHDEILTYEEILRVASTAVRLGIVHIRVTGGEPLLRRGIVEFIFNLSSLPGVKDVSITTNGILLDETGEGLRQAGVSRLNISLDTLRPDRFKIITGSNDWSRVWQGIARAESLGFYPIKINMVPVRGVNDDEIGAFARLTLERPIHVRFIEFMPIGAGDRWSTQRCVTGDEVRTVIEQQLGRLEPVSGQSQAGPSDTYKAAGAKGVIGFISPITKHFCSSCRRLRLTSDGKIRPCLLSDTEIDVKSPMRGGCNDAEIERLLRLAINVKPERHYINLEEVASGCCRRTMSRIGG